MNIQFWDELAELHAGPSDYNLSNYDPKKYALRNIELNALGSVEGKRILHLQCHIGLDSFALEMLGAKVTAIDYSEKAINIANSIKQKFHLSSQFYCSSVDDLSALDLGLFDIVFTSYGVLVWLEHLNLWAKTIATHLGPGGRLILIDEHPVSRMFSDPSADHAVFNLNPTLKYINNGQPLKAGFEYSYATNRKSLRNKEQYLWSHSLSEIFSSLLDENLAITQFQEFNKCFYKAFTQLSLRHDGWWYFSDNQSTIPLMFLLIAKMSDQ